MTFKHENRGLIIIGVISARSGILIFVIFFSAPAVGGMDVRKEGNSIFSQFALFVLRVCQI